MSNRQQMTEQEIRDEIGPRGRASINSKNRNLVRRWLRAQNLPTNIVDDLALADLRHAYNDTTNEKLDALRDQAQRERNKQATQLFDNGDHEDTQDDEDQTTSASQYATDNGSQEPQDQAQQLAQLLASMMQGSGSGPVDADQVREVVREELEQHRQTITIERPDGTTHTPNGAQHHAMPRLLTMVSAGVHVWLAGPAGSGKTTLAEQAADAMGLDFYSTGKVSSDFRLIGFTDATGQTHRTPFREAYEHGGVFLWDEVDGSNPNALISFNQALANDSFPFPDGMVEKHPNFIAIAAGNTFGHGATSEYVGRTKIDAAFLDRFVTLHIDYDEELERRITPEHYAHWTERVQRIRHQARNAGVHHVVGTRAIVHGCKLLAAGMDTDDVLAATVRKGLNEATWQKIAA